MRSLTVKTSLLFVLVSMISVLVVAVWVGERVDSEFDAYCLRACAGISSPGVGPMQGQSDQCEGELMRGALEVDYLETIHTAVWLAALVAGLAAVGLAMLFSRLITDPLNRLKSSVQLVQAGDLSQRAHVETGDEIGDLAAAFNSLAEQLEENDKGRKQLLADVVHELRTPLSIIQGNLEAWRDGVMPATPETIGPVHDEAVLLSRLITDLRDLSLAEAGQLSLTREATDLRPLITSVVAPYIEHAGIHQVRVTTDIPDDSLPEVNADPVRVRQVLRNLLDRMTCRTSSSISTRPTRRGSAAVPARA
jgi:signal transduction histidine kinase